MRRIVLIACGGEVVLLVFAVLRLIFGRIRSDAAGQGMAQAYSIIALIVALLLIVPAALLALNGKWMWFDLVLVVIAAFFVFVSVGSTF